MLDRETQPHYWLTVVAQDHGIVTLSASVEVSIALSIDPSTTARMNYGARRLMKTSCRPLRAADFFFLFGNAAHPSGTMSIC